MHEQPAALGVSHVPNAVLAIEARGVLPAAARERFGGQIVVIMLQVQLVVCIPKRSFAHVDPIP